MASRSNGDVEVNVGLDLTSIFLKERARRVGEVETLFGEAEQEDMASHSRIS